MVFLHDLLLQRKSTYVSAVLLKKHVQFLLGSSVGLPILGNSNHLQTYARIRIISHARINFNSILCRIFRICFFFCFGNLKRMAARVCRHVLSIFSCTLEIFIFYYLPSGILFQKAAPTVLLLYRQSQYHRTSPFPSANQFHPIQ